ncbi:hypothetical protein FB107DRAFT_275894 [Schizophyllum commune]
MSNQALMQTATFISDPTIQLDRGLCVPGSEKIAGYHVFATARTVKALSELVALGITTLPLDVTSDESVEALKDAVSEITGGRLSVLINNAGQIIPPSPATDMDISAAQRMFDTNVFGAMRMAKAFAPLLVEDGDARIVNVGSMAGTIPFPLESAYAASKATVHSYSDALRVELAPLGVQVINLCSGGVATDATKEKSPLMLAGNSLFKPFEREMQAAHDRANNTNAMAPELYAKEVFVHMSRLRPQSWMWIGTGSWVIWFFTTFFSRTFMDSWMAKRVGLPSESPSEFAPLKDD